MRAVTYLFVRQFKNRLLKLLRQPAWLAFYVLMASAAAVTWLGGRGSAEAPGASLAAWLEAGAAGLALVLMVVGAWSGASQPPWPVEEADVVWLFTSPVSPRHVVAAHLVHRLIGSLLSALPISLVVGVGLRDAGWAAQGRDLILTWIALGSAGWWGVAAGAGAWGWVAREGLDRMAARRQRLRAGLALVAVGAVTWVGWPALQRLPAGVAGGAGAPSWAPTAELLRPSLERLALLGRWSPLRAVTGLASAPWSEAGRAAAVAEAVLWVAAAIFVVTRLAGDYYEAAAGAASRQAALAWAAGPDPQVDATGLAAAMLGVRRPGVGLRPFGSGPWAMTWAQAVRYLRLEMASLKWVRLLVALMGAGVGVLARAVGAASWGVLAVPLLLAMAAGAPYFAEEVRRPYLFVLPGPAWQRVLAAGVVGWFDACVSVLLLYGPEALTASIGWQQGLAGALYLVTAAAAGQAGAMLPWTVTPRWLGLKTRESLRLYLAALALLPGVLPWAVAAAGGAGGGAGVASSAAGWLVALGIGTALNLAAAAAGLAATTARFGLMEME